MNTEEKAMIENMALECILTDELFAGIAVACLVLGCAIGMLIMALFPAHEDMTDDELIGMGDPVIDLLGDMPPKATPERRFNELYCNFEHGTCHGDTCHKCGKPFPFDRCGL